MIPSFHYSCRAGVAARRGNSSRLGELTPAERRDRSRRGTRRTSDAPRAARIASVDAARSRTQIGAHARDPGPVRRQRARRRVVVLGAEGREVRLRERVGDPPVEFPQFGINITVLEPDRPASPRRTEEEAFLAVYTSESGVMKRRSDHAAFLLTSPGSEHAIVAGETPVDLLGNSDRRARALYRFPPRRYGATLGRRPRRWAMAVISGRTVPASPTPNWVFVGWKPPTLATNTLGIVDFRSVRTWLTRTCRAIPWPRQNDGRPDPKSGVCD